MRPFIALASGYLLGAELVASLPQNSTSDYTDHCSGRDGCWTNFAPIDQGPRQEHGTVVLGDNIYILGGITLYNGTGITPTLNSVDAYSISRGHWKSVASLPVPLNHANTAAVDGKLYVLGGLLGGEVWRATPNCYMYDPKADRWTALKPMPEEQARGSAAMGVYRDTIYLAAGMYSLDPTVGGLQDSVGVVTAYNTTSTVWTILPSLPAPRDHVGGAIVGHKFYVLGGRDHGRVNVRNTTYALDLRSSRAVWAQKADMPTARGGISTGVVGKIVYTFGGEGDLAPGSNGVFNQTEAYDTKTNVWTRLAPMAHPRHGTSAASAQNKVFIPGGGIAEGDAAVNTFDAFSPC